MFDIGFFELLVIGIIGLVVVGPERLPDAVRTTVRWWTQLKQTLGNAKDELEREVGADEIRRELHNERILKELRESKESMERTFGEAEKKFAQDLKAVTEQAEALKQNTLTDESRQAGSEQTALESTLEAVPESDPTADNRRLAEDFLPEEQEVKADQKSAEEFLPEEYEDDEDLEDPEYPEHLHDHGDPEHNPHHPDHVKEWEDKAWDEVDRLDPADADKSKSDKPEPASAEADPKTPQK